MEDGSLLQKIRKIYQVEDELDEAEKKKAAALIRNIFRYMDKHAKDIMTHRTDIVYIDAKVKLEDALKFMLEENYSRFTVVKVDIDESMDLARKFSITTVPTVVVFKDGKEMDRLVGFIPKDSLKQKVESYL